MGAATTIAWTDHTFNPWRGCARVSPGCQHCYAEALAKRTGIHGTWGPEGERVISSDAYWRHPLQWDRAAAAAGVRRRVFCASMADVFEDRPDLVPHRRRVFDLIGATDSLDWLVLTKRPENVAAMMKEIGLAIPPNVWLGTTTENQEQADRRVPHLLAVEARVRFLSIEPQLGPVDVSRWLYSDHDRASMGRQYHSPLPGTEPYAKWFARVDWVIVGGESGPGARPFDLSWARSLVAQCNDAGTPVFVKQMGRRVQRTEFGGVVTVDAELARIKDPKGGDMTEWPADLRIREIPALEPAS